MIRLGNPLDAVNRQAEVGRAATEAGLCRGEEPEWEAEPLDVEDAIGRYLA